MKSLFDLFRREDIVGESRDGEVRCGNHRTCGDIDIGSDSSFEYIPCKDDLNKVLQLGKLSSYKTLNKEGDFSSYKAYVSCKSHGRQKRIVEDTQESFIKKVLGKKDEIISEDYKKVEDIVENKTVVSHVMETYIRSENGRDFKLTTRATEASNDLTLLVGTLTEVYRL